VKIREQAVASLAGEDVGQVSSTYYQMVKEEVGETCPSPNCRAATIGW
jgi:hypothetical protein